MKTQTFGQSTSVDTIDFSIIDIDTNFSADLDQICGAFSSDIKIIFPKQLAAYVLLTKKSRRNIWFAYISALKQKSRYAFLGKDKDTLRHKFLYASAHDLLLEAYGEIPKGFIGIVKSPGVRNLDHRSFVALHRILQEGKVDAFHLHGQSLNNDIMVMLDEAPVELAKVSIVKKFISKRMLKHFEAAIDQLSIYYDQDMHQTVYKLLQDGSKPVTAINHFYKQLAFPAPVLEGYAHISHISNVKQMLEVALDFENCLAHKIEDALAGSHQYYLYEADHKQAVVCLKKMTDKVFQLDEVQVKDDIFTSSDDIPHLHAILSDAGIHYNLTSLNSLLSKLDR